MTNYPQLSIASLSAADYYEIANDTEFKPDVLEKIVYLQTVLTMVNSDPFLCDRLVLKGGTALNLYYLDTPRLSVDLDFAEVYNKNYQIADEEKNFHGIEPFFINGCYQYAIVHKFPVYDDHSITVHGYFSLAFLLNNKNLCDFFGQIYRYQKMTNVTTSPLLKIYKDDKNHQLTPRETECLFYILRGKTSKEVGRILNMSPKTVEFHIEHLKNKFNCHSKSELITKAMESGYLEKIPLSILKANIL